MHSLDVIRITALTAMCFNIVLTLLVLGRDYRSILHRVYLLWGIDIALWNWGAYHLSEKTISPEDAFFWAKILQLGVIFIPLAMFHLCLVFSKTQVKGWVLPVLYLAHICLASTLFFNWYITGVKWLPVGYWSIPGPGFHFFTIFYIGLTVAIMVILFRKLKGAPPTQRTRLRALRLAVVGLWVFGSNDMMPIWGRTTYPWPFNHINFYPVGSLAAIFYVVVIGYSVLQHQLLDIHVTLSRFAAQFVRLAFMVLVGFALLLLLSTAKPESFSPFSLGASMGVLVVSAVVASLFFPQFFGKGTDTLERKILGDRFEYHARVKSLIETMKSFPDPQFLLQELDSLLVSTMKVRGYQIILLDDATRAFVLFHSQPAKESIDLSELGIDSPVFRFFQQTHAMSLSCNLVYDAERESILQRDAREQLKIFEPEFCFPFFTGDDLVGLMLLGPKGNGDLFTPHDLRLLTELSSNLGLLLNQVRLRQQLQTVHEQDLMGRMSRGLAHDLNNLLTPVQTLLQLLRESKMNQETIDELLPMGLRNLETVRTYVSEALFFSRSSKLQGKLGLLDETVREAMSLVQTNSAGPKGITITFQCEGEVAIEMDNVLIKRLLCNLLSNACDASPAGSQIEIQLAPLPKTELNRDWYRIKVVDHGEGISQENLQRVFTPYFTTKNTGDGKRGFGLGLAIARNIVQLHGGNLSITSKEKKGTTVQIDLPSKLVQAKNQPRMAGNQRMGMATA
jgi:signal transduction histidine kinase